jgi:cation:H+ antiporter
MLLIFIGFIGIVLAGAHLIVYSGVKIANIIGIKPWIIGITVFAIGTSLPEIATSLSAAFRKLPSVSVGNIVGSNIFNILLILGVVSIIRPITISDLSVLHFELPLLVFFSLTIYAFLALGSGLGRIKGGILALFYLGFIYFLFI